MESLSGNGKPEAIELRLGMTSDQAASLLAAMLETVPRAVGVNNHQGSRATADPALMAALMPALAAHRLFFLDSRTATASLAYSAARQVGVRSAYRTVFLDDTPTREATLHQLALAERHAREHGWAIAIGHPHPSTLEALNEFLPQLPSRGVRLTFASHLVH